MPSDIKATLTAIVERTEKATPGPWTAERRWSNECEIVPRITCAPDSDRGCGWIADLIGAPYLGHKSTLPNAAFIAAARTDVPRLARALLRVVEECESRKGSRDQPYDTRAADILAIIRKELSK